MSISWLMGTYWNVSKSDDKQIRNLPWDWFFRQSKDKIEDSNLDLHESVSLFQINPRDMFFIKPRRIFSLLNNMRSV